jgi:hypothetical protein
MSVVLEALGNLNDKRIAGEAVKEEKMMEVMAAVYDQLNSFKQEREVFLASQEELSRQVEALRKQNEMLEHSLRNMQEDIPDEERAKSKAKIANHVRWAAEQARNHRSASNIDFRLQFAAQKKESVEWEGDPFEFNIRNVVFPIRQGWNHNLPHDVADALKSRIEKVRESEARRSVLKVGRRRDGRRILSYGEVDQWQRRIDQEFRGRGKGAMPVPDNAETFLQDYMDSEMRK